MVGHAAKQTTATAGGTQTPKAVVSIQQDTSQPLGSGGAGSSKLQIFNISSNIGGSLAAANGVSTGAGADIQSPK